MFGALQMLINSPTIDPAVKSIATVAVLLMVVMAANRTRRSRDAIEREKWEQKRVEAVYLENTRLRDESDALRTIVRRLEAERDRAEALARWWCKRAHSLWHQINGVLMRVPEAIRPEAPEELPLLDDAPGIGARSMPGRYLHVDVIPGGGAGG